MTKHNEEKPSHLTFTEDGKKLRLHWKSCKNALSYEILVSKDKNFAASRAFSVEKNEIEFEVEPGNTLHYKVRALFPDDKITSATAEFTSSAKIEKDPAQDKPAATEKIAETKDEPKQRKPEQPKQKPTELEREEAMGNTTMRWAIGAIAIIVLVLLAIFFAPNEKKIVSKLEKEFSGPSTQKPESYDDTTDDKKLVKKESGPGNLNFYGTSSNVVNNYYRISEAHHFTDTAPVDNSSVIPDEDVLQQRTFEDDVSKAVVECQVTIPAHQVLTIKLHPRERKRGYIRVKPIDGEIVPIDELGNQLHDRQYKTGLRSIQLKSVNPDENVSVLIIISDTRPPWFDNDANRISDNGGT